MLREGLLIHDKTIGICNAVEIVHSLKYSVDGSSTTELVAAFFISNAGNTKQIVNYLFRKILKYTHCDYLVFDQAKIYPSQQELAILSSKVVGNQKAAPRLTSCITYVISLLFQDYYQSNLVWGGGNYKNGAVDLKFEAFCAILIKVRGGLIRTWGIQIVSTFESIRNLNLDLKYGALVGLATSGVVQLLIDVIKGITTNEGLSSNELILLKSSLKCKQKVRISLIV